MDNNKKRINILFVCHGNICRSPMAEFVFKKIIKDNNLDDSFYVESAATSTDEIGNPIYFEAQKQLIKHGIIDFTNKRARQVVKEDYDKFNYIFLMDDENIDGIKKIIKDDKKNKIHKLLYFVGAGDEIEDPWYTRNFDKVYNQIETGCKLLIEKNLLN